jgi:hypothetical protein
VLEKIMGELRASQSSAVGILGLSVGAYLNLASALVGNGDLPVEEALLPFLSAYNSAIRQASQDNFHWRRMAVPFHPVEPDILSVLTLVHLTLTYRKRSIFDLLEVFPLSWQSRTILNGALQQQFPG